MFDDCREEGYVDNVVSDTTLDHVTDVAYSDANSPMTVSEAIEYLKICPKDAYVGNVMTDDNGKVFMRVFSNVAYKNGLVLFDWNTP